MLTINHLPACYGFDKKDVDLLNFIIKKSKNVDSPFTLNQLYREYSTMDISQHQQAHEKIRSQKTFQRRMLQLRSKLNLVEFFDTDTKVKMMFGLSVPIDDDFLNELRKEANVEVDDHNRITKYEKKDGGLNLKGKHVNTKSIPDVLERDKQMMKFLAEKCNIINTPMAVMNFTKQFKVSTGCKLTISQLYSRYRCIRDQIYTSTGFDKPTRIKMMFISSAAVNKNVLKDLRKDAIVKVDKGRRITKYTANDGSLTLGRAANQKKRINRIFASDPSEDDDEEEREAEESDEEEEEARKNNDKKNIPITKSGRISKSRYLNADFSRDSDNDEFQSSTSKINGRPAKNGNSTGLTPKVSHLKLQKRKIEDSSSTSESPSKIAKPGKVADIQNNKKSVQKDKPYQKDVVYDGPGVTSLPIPLNIKPERNDNYDCIHERNEYKPDLSYLSNPQQYSGDDIIDGPDFENPQDLMNNPIDDIVKIEETETPEIICDTPFVPINSSTTDEVSTENTLTSSKNFMNFLRGLVVTLDTPMLAKLQRKIEDSIKKLENEDQKVPATDILTALRTIFLAVRKSAKPIQPSKDSTSLFVFLMMLRNSVITMNLSILNNIQEEMKEAIKELDSQDKSVPIQSIQSVLDTVLLMLSY